MIICASRIEVVEANKRASSKKSLKVPKGMGKARVRAAEI